ncbi:ABC transporter permease [Nonomuraea cavernae]|uniref:ABC transporter permease n=1 Tax=Nonomuraea cavernae TaxID=2045107 RepID=A0A917Z9Y2_9ACTN|nr:ABC transporter permease [Nonomuraea cavernae]MCA2185651.1 ABC transporter permease [Nonomuraea cavernae]GGO78167.1 ABC transporter permease [Nonomuraea cavernae]
MIAKCLRDWRRTLIWWTIGIGAFMALYLGTYQSIKQAPEIYGPAGLAKFPGALRDLMGGLEDFTSGTGYLQSVVYQLFVPFLFIVCAMVLAGRALAGPEEAGTLELIVTLPVDRRRLVLERFASIALGLLAVAAVTLLVTWAMAEAVGMGVGFDRILAAHLGVYLLALLFGTVTLAVGAATGRKAAASAVMGVWAVLGYMVVTIGRNVEAIAWLKWVSPFHYYAEGRPLYEGLPAGDYLVLAAATAVLALTAVLAFDRRDVGV